MYVTQSATTNSHYANREEECVPKSWLLLAPVSGRSASEATYFFKKKYIRRLRPELFFASRVVSRDRCLTPPPPFHEPPTAHLTLDPGQKPQHPSSLAAGGWTVLCSFAGGCASWLSVPSSTQNSFSSIFCLALTRRFSEIHPHPARPEISTQTHYLP